MESGYRVYVYLKWSPRYQSVVHNLGMMVFDWKNLLQQLSVLTLCFYVCGGASNHIKSIIALIFYSEIINVDLNNGLGPFRLSSPRFDREIASCICRLQSSKCRSKSF